MASTGFQCRVCRRNFQTLDDVREHFLLSHRVRIKCAHCNIVFASIRTLRQHINQDHVRRLPSFPCQFCPRRFARRILRRQHETNVHVTTRTHFSVFENSLSFRHQSYRLDFVPGSMPDLPSVFTQYADEMKLILQRELLVKRRFNFAILLHVQFEKTNDITGLIVAREIFTVRPKYVMMDMGKHDVIDQMIYDMSLELTRRLAMMMTEESNWTLSHVSSCIIETSENVAGGCGGKAYEEFWKSLKKRDYLIDPLSVMPPDSQACFLYAVALATKTDVSEFNYNHDHTTPMPLSKIMHFEKANPGLRIHVFAFERDAKGQVQPVYTSVVHGDDDTENMKTVFLLIVEYAKDLYHYLCITDIDMYLHRYKTGKSRYKTCYNCLQVLSSEVALASHKELCMKERPLLRLYPSPGERIQFSLHHALIRQPFTAYLDFESKLVPEKVTVQNGINTYTVAHHVPISYSLVVLDNANKIIFQRTEANEETIMKFCDAALNEAADLCYKLRAQYPTLPLLSAEQRHRLNQENQCCVICHQPICEGRVLHHDHYTNVVLGPAHNECNLLDRSCKSKLVIYVHNLTNYDGHFILKYYKPRNAAGLSGIPLNSQKFKTLSYGKLLFLDSAAFLKSSLSKLVESLHHSRRPKPFSLLQTSGLCRNDAEVELLCRKGVFPYSFCTSLKRLIISPWLPPIESFYCDMTYSECTQEDYAFAQQVYSHFQCKSMLDYLLLYNRTDTLLLACVFQNFRAETFDLFGLEVNYCVSLPQLSFEACLKWTGTSIAMITEEAITLAITQAIRGGLVQVTQRLVEIKPEESGLKHIFYTDANNLYGLCLAQKLPFDDYRYVEPETLEHIDWLTFDCDQDIAYILCVDLSYRDPRLHDLHDELPFAPESRNVTFDDMSPYMKTLLLALRGERSRNMKEKKLVATLCDKKNYVIHCKHLKLCLQNGLKIDKIHNILSFRQKAIFNKYIACMTQKRKDSQCSFDKFLAKLYVNAIFGRSIENKTKHVTVRFCSTSSRSARYIGHPLAVSRRIINPNLIAVFLRKHRVMFDRAYLVGFSVLELSKTFMYKTYYTDILPALGRKNIELLYMDTDSYQLLVRNTSRQLIYDKLKPILDCSNLPPSHPHFDASNRMTPGFFKDETASRAIKSVVAIKPKSYCLLYENGENEVKCKGVAHANLTKIKYEHFKSALIRSCEYVSIQRLFRAKNNAMTTVESLKKSISPIETKRFWLNCGLHSRALGHYMNSRSSRCNLCGI